MSRGRKVALLALGALVSVAAVPAAAQVVVGEYRPSVDVNWDVLDKLGPEPTLPGLITRPPSAAVPAAPHPVARPAAPAKATGFRPYAEAPKAAPKAAAAKPVKAVTPVAASPKAEPPKAEVAKVDVPPAEAPKPAPAPAPVRTVEAAKPSGPEPKPVRPDVANDVPAPAKPPLKAEASKVEAPKVEAPKAPEPPKAEPPKPAEAPKPAEPPSAVQFVKTPPPAAPAPVVEAPKAPEPPKAEEAPKPAPAVVAPPLPVAPPAPSPAAVAPPTQIVALPPAAPPPAPAATPSRKGDNLTVPFATDSSHLQESARGELDRLAQRMDKDENLNLQLMAYAAGDEANASKARRLSLSRALEIRKYLMEMGVRSTRIEVRALGNKVESGPADRVDAVLVTR